MEKRVSLILGLVIAALAVIGYGFYQSFTGEPATEPAPNTEATPQTPPEEVVAEFYDWYISTDEPRDRTAVAARPEIAASLRETIRETDQASSRDPFYCATARPASYSIENAQALDTQAFVSVAISFGSAGPEQLSLIVELILQNEVWKIADIVCYDAKA